MAISRLSSSSLCSSFILSMHLQYIWCVFVWREHLNNCGEPKIKRKTAILSLNERLLSIIIFSALDLLNKCTGNDIRRQKCEWVLSGKTVSPQPSLCLCARIRSTNCIQFSACSFDEYRIFMVATHFLLTLCTIIRSPLEIHFSYVSMNIVLLLCANADALGHGLGANDADW